jgi:hypothetical protein
MTHLPAIPGLQKVAPRKGFLQPSEFVKLRDELPVCLRDADVFLYPSGWRKGAMRSLQNRSTSYTILEVVVFWGLFSVRFRAWYRSFGDRLDTTLTQFFTPIFVAVPPSEFRPIAP